MSTRDTVVTTLIALAVAGAVVTGGLVLQRNRAAQEVPVQSSPQAATNAAPNAAPAAPESPKPVTNWEQYIPTGRLIGPKNAALTLVEFADFECPACKTLHDRLKELRTQYPRDFAISFHHVPLHYHEMAYPAARAAECAAEQGRFEAYHDKIFENAESLKGVSFRNLAVEAGVPDLKKFSACAARTDPVKQIEDDRGIAFGTLQITGTPTVLLNGRMYSYAPNNSELKQMIEEARSHAGAH
jgi:protein-disulfide isomerase